jgi:hypothetical protein
MPSGRVAYDWDALVEKVYGGVPPLALIIHPTYDVNWIPLGHEVVVIVSGPPAVVTVTVAVAVVEPVAFVAVRV